MYNVLRYIQHTLTNQQMYNIQIEKKRQKKNKNYETTYRLNQIGYDITKYYQTENIKIDVRSKRKVSSSVEMIREISCTIRAATAYECVQFGIVFRKNLRNLDNVSKAEAE